MVITPPEDIIIDILNTVEKKKKHFTNWTDIEAPMVGSTKVFYEVQDQWLMPKHKACH